MQNWKLQVSVSVSDFWVADGFDLSDRLSEVADKLKELLPFAYDGEIQVEIKVVKAPGVDTISSLQGGY